jgi:acyl carrier protein
MLAQDLKGFLLDEVPGIDLNSSLVKQVGSLDLMTIIVRIEKRFKIRFSNDELVLENFESFGKLLEILQAKVGNKTGSGDLL